MSRKRFPLRRHAAHLFPLRFSWEAPNQDSGGNQFSPDDTTNYLAFLQELRADPAGKGLYISAAVPITTYIGSDGKPLTDMSEFAKVLDHIAIMNYDTNVRISHGLDRKASDNSFFRLNTLSRRVPVQVPRWMTLVPRFRMALPPRPLRPGLMPVSLRTRSYSASLPMATPSTLSLPMLSTALEI